MKKLFVLTTLAMSSVACAQLKIEASLAVDGVERIHEVKDVDINSTISFADNDIICDVLVEQAADNQYMLISQISTKIGEEEKVVLAEPVLIIAEDQQGTITLESGVDKNTPSTISLTLKIVSDLNNCCENTACECQ